jgi:hypothetical protein
MAAVPRFDLVRWSAADPIPSGSVLSILDVALEVEDGANQDGESQKRLDQAIDHA